MSNFQFTSENNGTDAFLEISLSEGDPLITLTQNGAGKYITSNGDHFFDKSVAFKYRSVDESDETGGQRIIGVNSASAATITVSSTDILKRGYLLTVKDESGSAGMNNITIDTEGSETIDGAALKVINTNYGVVNLYSNGKDLFIF